MYSSSQLRNPTKLLNTSTKNERPIGKDGNAGKVEQPTEWCAGLVVKQKLAQLAGATVFSTLDANSGFWSHMSPLY